MQLYLFDVAMAVISGIIYTILLLRESEADVSDDGLRLTLRHSLIVRRLAAIVLLGIPLFALGAAYFALPNNQVSASAMSRILAVLPVLGLPLFWELTRYRLTIMPEGLDCRSPWKRHQFMAWKDITEVSYSTTFEWFIFHNGCGNTFRVHTWVPGVHVLLDLAEDRLPSTAFANAKLGYLELVRPFPTDQHRDAEDT